MREFRALYKFNFKRMINTWMMRVLAIVVLAGVTGAILYLHGNMSTPTVPSTSVEMQAEGISEAQIATGTIANTEMAEKIAFYIIVFTLYLFILLCGSIITSSVALERTSKVSEIITYRVSVLKLIYSKVLSLYTIILIILTIAAAEFFVAVKIKYISLDIVWNILKAVNFGPQELALVGVIIMVGIVAYTVLYICVGTLIKSAEQIQFSQLPVAAIVLIGYVITVLCRQNTDALLSKVCTYIPLFSPFLVVPKLFEKGSRLTEFVIIGVLTVIYLIIGNICAVKLYKKENC